MSAHGTTSVYTVGHSLGGAISLLDAMYLLLHLPAGTTVKTISYGMPRVSLLGLMQPLESQLCTLQVGNQAFANYIDAQVNAVHITNKEVSIIRNLYYDLWTHIFIIGRSSNSSGTISWIPSYLGRDTYRG